jgi:hypothetical protein
VQIVLHCNIVSGGNVVKKLLASLDWSLAAGCALVTIACGAARPRDSGSVEVGAPGAAPITVSSVVPSELNPPFPGPPPTGGAPNATPAQAAAFAWNEFIALNWPAGPQQGQPGQRDTPSNTCRFGDPSCTGPTVWETFRGKVETFPGTGNPPGYVNDSSISYGYDALPQYVYAVQITACDPSQSGDPTPWVNLDETDEITLASMYAGVVNASSSPGNSAPQLIRFLAKSNRSQFIYVAGNSDPSNPLAQWWSAIPQSVVSATKAYLAQNLQSPPPGSSTMVSQLNGTLEVKAAWRPLNPWEISSGRFHTQTVRFYEPVQGQLPCYRDAVWGLVALHIIQKTPSAPYFIYATFEQADNILREDGTRVEGEDGRILPPAPSTATTPQVCLIDPQPSAGSGSGTPSTLGKVIETSDPTTCTPLQTPVYCTAPGSRLYYQDETQDTPNAGSICVDRRDHNIPDYVIAANRSAHAAIRAYLAQQGISSAPWLSYKLVNVQYYPYDKVITNQTPNGSLYNTQPPYTAQNPAPSSFYQANIVVETNRSLQLFSGGLSPYVSTDWNMDGTQHKNSIYGGKAYNMGGCMGCHGSQGQNPTGQAGDFSVILARGSVIEPEVPAVQSQDNHRLSTVHRNRSLASPATTTSKQGGK